MLQVPTSYSLGFGKPTSTFVFGSSDRAFGWPGAGGSFGFADPDTGIGFGYVMNRMCMHLFSDPRELSLRQALFRDVLGAGRSAERSAPQQLDDRAEVLVGVAPPPNAE